MRSRKFAGLVLLAAAITIPVENAATKVNSARSLTIVSMLAPRVVLASAVRGHLNHFTGKPSIRFRFWNHEILHLS